MLHVSPILGDNSQVSHRRVVNFICRFRKDDLRCLFQLLQIEPTVVLPNRRCLDGFTTLLIMLKQFAYPARNVDLAVFFGLQPEVISNTFNHMVEYVHAQFGHLLSINEHLLNPA